MVIPPAHHIVHVHHWASLIAVSIGSFTAIAMSMWGAYYHSRHKDTTPKGPHSQT
jgi:hypothetical protein